MDKYELIKELHDDATKPQTGNQEVEELKQEINRLEDKCDDLAKQVIQLRQEIDEEKENGDEKNAFPLDKKPRSYSPELRKSHIRQLLKEKTNTFKGSIEDFLKEIYEIDGLPSTHTDYQAIYNTLRDMDDIIKVENSNPCKYGFPINKKVTVKHED